MTQQTNAQRLADWLDGFHKASVHHECAQELRRLDAENQRLEAALQAQIEIAAKMDTQLFKANNGWVQAEAERDQLARWKSTNAPRLEALEGLLADARAEAAKGAEAISSLASEREANAILTAENDQLRAQVERLQSEVKPTIEDNSQNWAGMDGATAWHLIERHSENWGDIGKMMHEWLSANQKTVGVERLQGGEAQT